MKLPDDMLALADTASNEEAWKPADVARALEIAITHGLACVGGQFQFRGPFGIAEMYWLNADSTPRRTNENWHSYVIRANCEVLTVFNRLMQTTDFDSEARNWKHIVEAMKSGLISDAKQHLWFVAYFNEEEDKAEQGGGGYGSPGTGSPSPHR